MKIVVPKENPDETRVPLVPQTISSLAKLGADISIESNLGAHLNISNEAYEKAGAAIVADKKSLLTSGDLVLRLKKPTPEDISLLKKGSIHVSYMDPFNDKELLQKLAQAGVSALCMEMIPRSTRAQKMDALSSQASLAGYVAVILASQQLPKIFPMMMTPAGTISPARVFIIGAGVAGLQAIATARRLGARVDAFDTRPVVEEQVKSLGASFAKIDIGETGQTEQGYAKQLTPEQLEKQRQGMKKYCAQADIVITTAQVFGRKAPLIITKDMVEAMKPGSILIDMAVETGGNVEGSQVDQEVNVNGVRILGYSNLPGKVALDASLMYSSNLANLIGEFWNKETKNFELKVEDEIIQSCLLTHNGQIVHPQFK